jgi:hypothetical protein
MEGEAMSSSNRQLEVMHLMDQLAAGVRATA